MKTISISDARNHLPSIIDDVMSTHEQVVVIRYGAPTVVIMPFRDRGSGANPYPLRGYPISVAKDFDEPMPDLWGALAVAEEPGACRVGKGSLTRPGTRIGSDAARPAGPGIRKKKG